MKGVKENVKNRDKREVKKKKFRAFHVFLDMASADLDHNTCFLMD